MSKATPGPWHVGDPKGIIVYDANGNAIADAKTFHGRHEVGVAPANARLIAAAPDLLESIGSLLDAIEDSDERPVVSMMRMLAIVSSKPAFDAVDAARAAIAKAKGNPQ